MKDKNIFVSITHVPEIQYEQGWDNFLWMQDCARKHNVKVTIGVRQELFLEDYVTEKLLEYRDQGDEIALLLNIIEGEEGECSIDKAFEIYKNAMGEYPEAILSSRQDAPLWRHIKEKYPTVIAGVGFAFEEGDHVFRGHQIFNREWMDFCEGTPWWPFWPSSRNKQCPGTPGDNIEIMNFPWLVRDMIMSVIGRDDFYSSEVGDLLRSKLIDENDFSYLKRFFDVYVDQAKHNTHTFYSMLQESGWLCPGPRVFEETHEVYKYIYEKYFTEIFASRDDLVFVTLAEYAKWHKNEFKMENPPTVCVWDDIIYDSGKQYTWYQDQNARLLFDSDQGGSLVDIRPYVANIEKYRGSDSKDLWDASYPFLIQFFHRCNSIYKCELEIGGEQFSLAEKESKLKELLRTEDSSEFIFEPVELKTSIGALSVQTSYKINRESFKLEVRRALKGKLSGEVSVKVREHFTGCWAADAHPSSLKGLELVLKAGDAERKLSYAYKSREIELDAASSAEVFFPVEGFRLSLIPEKDCKCFVKEGNINYNFYELGVESDIEKSVFDETIRTDLVVAPSSDK